jgi:uncharacterized membrane protein (DUF2068 family)
MKSPFSRLAAVLALLGAIDLIMVPVMYHQNTTHPGGNPPMAAIVLGGILGVLTLAGIPGLAQGKRWAFWLVLVTRVIDMVSAVLGVFGGPGTLFVVMGVVILVLSVGALVLLFRQRPARTASAASAA